MCILWTPITFIHDVDLSGQTYSVRDTVKEILRHVGNVGLK
jgi:hypothetical protein